MGLKPHEDKFTKVTVMDDNYSPVAKRDGENVDIGQPRRVVPSNSCDVVSLFGQVKKTTRINILIQQESHALARAMASALCFDWR